MQHVGVGQDDIALVSELPPRSRRGITVIDTRVQHPCQIEVATHQAREALELQGIIVHHFVGFTSAFIENDKSSMLP